MKISDFFSSIAPHQKVSQHNSIQFLKMISVHQDYTPVDDNELTSTTTCQSDINKMADAHTAIKYASNSANETGRKCQTGFKTRLFKKQWRLLYQLHREYFTSGLV